MKKYLSTQEAAEFVGCSKNNIIKKIKDGYLLAKIRPLGERSTYRVLTSSLRKYKEDNADNKRLGRELYSRPYSRKPLVFKGYTLIYKPHHHRANKDGYVPEHVLVMEEYLGRQLTDKEVVHHIDRVRTNNELENLMLYNSKNEHMAMHTNLRKAFLIAQGNPKLEAKIIKLADKYSL